MSSPVLTNKPAPTDILAQSQVDLQNDMQYVQSAFNRDHKVTFNTPTTSDNQQGLHRKVSLISNNVGAVTPGADSVLYSFGGNLLWRNATIGPVQLTNTAAGTPISATNGFSYLPGGLMIQWGQSTTSSTDFPAAPPVNFAPAFSAPPYNVQVSVFNSGDNSKNVQVVSVTSSALNVTTRDPSSGKSQPVTYCWLAIGPK